MMRKLSLWYSQRKEVFDRGLVSDTSKVPKSYKGKARNLYKCAKCKNAFRKGGVEVDHIDGIEMAKCENFDEYIGKILPHADKLQLLCVTCHSNKTTAQELGLE